MTTNHIRARVAAELAVHRGDLAEAAQTIEAALASAPPELRADLEEARGWLEEIVPAPRPSWPPAVGEA